MTAELPVHVPVSPPAHDGPGHRFGDSGWCGGCWWEQEGKFLPPRDRSLHAPDCPACLAREAPGVGYDREVLTNVLVYHGRENILGCGCGWSVLGASHPEHVADMYEAAYRDRTREAGMMRRHG